MRRRLGILCILIFSILSLKAEFGRALNIQDSPAAAKSKGGKSVSFYSGGSKIAANLIYRRTIRIIWTTEQ